MRIPYFVIVQLLEAVDECHCERPQGAKQSLKIASSLSLLAMTRLLPEAELLPYFAPGSRQRKSFTIIELIMVIIIMGIVLIPLGIMSMDFTREIVYSRDSGTAEGLVKVEMAKVNNLAFADLTLNNGYDNTVSNYEGYPYDLRRRVNYANSPTNTLKRVQVTVYPAGNTTAPLVNAITYVANVSFGAGAGGSAALGLQANSMVVSGGSISGNNLINVTLANSDTLNAITITQMTISFTGASGISLKKVNIAGITVFSGGAYSGETINLGPTFTLAANTSYSSPVFLEFNKSLASVTALIFIMSDSFPTVNYIW